VSGTVVLCLALASRVAAAEEARPGEAIASLATAARACEDRATKLALWSLSSAEAAELLSWLPSLGLTDRRLEAGLLARVGGREASALGLALLGREAADAEALGLRGDLESARGNLPRALELYRQAERILHTDSAIELRYHVASRMAELYLLGTPTVERALPYLREAIGLAHELGRSQEIDHLQELQQRFALEYSRLKGRADALRFQPVESHRGLLGSDARALVRQGQGLWVLDSGGAAYFDGLLWRASAAKEVFGYTALLGSDGALYATPINGGLVRLVGGSWSVLEPPKGYETNPIVTLLEHDGGLFLGGGRRVARMPLGGGPIEDLRLEGSGAVRRLGVLDGRLAVIADRDVFVHGDAGWAALGLARELPAGTGLLGGLVEHGTILWLATHRGVYRWSAGELRHYTVAHGLPANELNRLLRTSDGSLFATSTVAGVLARFDGDAWQSAPGAVSALDMALAEEVLLVATEAGLFRGRSQRWRILDSHSGWLGDQIEYAIRLEDEIWLLAQNRGVMRVAPDPWESFGPADGLPANAHFLAMARRGKDRWVGSDRGLHRLEGQHFVEVPLGEDRTRKEIFSLCPVGEGELLVGTTAGLIAMRPGGEVRPVELPSPVARALVPFGPERVLAATEGSGVVDLRRVGAGQYAVQNVWGQREGLCSDLAQAILASRDGEVWVGTDSGLAHAVLEKDGPMRWECLTEANGLPGRDITAIARLESGLLAVAFYLVGVGLFDGETWSLFGPEDGLPSTVLWSLVEPEPGVLWAGTGQGIWEVRLDAEPPRTYLEMDGVLYGHGSGSQTCALGRLLSSGEAAPGVKLRLGQRDYVPFQPVPDAGCAQGRPAGRPELKEVPQLRALGQSPWSFEDPEDLWYSVRVGKTAPGPFHRGMAQSLPDLEDGLVRLEVRAKSRWLTVAPEPLVLELRLDRPVPPWVWAALSAALALGVFLLRRQLRDAYLRVRHARFRPIPANPFTPKAPAQGRLLVGRDEVLQRWLAPGARPEAHAESRLVLGPLSAGKTSLLRELHRRATAAGHRAVILDLAEWQQESFGAFIEELRQRLSDADAEVQAPQAEEERRGIPGGSPLRLLDRELERLGRLQPAPRVFVLVDGFQLLDPLLAMSDTPMHQVLQALRSLLQRHRHLSLILALSGDEALLKNRFAELFFFSSVDGLGPLPQEATARLCVEPLAGLVYVAPQATQLVHALAGGHPILLQLVLHELVEQLVKAKTNVCTAAFVRGLVPALVEEARALEGWWQALTRPQQLVLARLAELAAEGGRLRVEEFTERESNRMGLLPQEARQALGSLRASLLLAGDENEVRFGAELMRAWVRQKQRFQAVLERERMQMGPYELLSKLGQGGMGTVYRARHLTGGDVVAVKVLHAGALEDPESRHRFFREAEIGIRLRHSNIVAIYEKGEHGDQAYLAMEFLQGTTLRSYIQDKGPMKALNAAKILRAVADALRSIHELGVIHRDIKSENIFLAASEGTKKTVPKLMDFGLARSEASRVTRTGVIVGTVAYMSPEQATGGTLGPATDLYSLGVVLFEMLTAQMPFTGLSDVAVLSQVVNRPPPDIRQLRPDVPEALAALLERLLAKEPAARPGSAAEMVALLEEIIALGAQEPDTAAAPKAQA
jgi:ligand-binding sensor domain-containing protein